MALASQVSSSSHVPAHSIRCSSSTRAVTERRHGSAGGTLRLTAAGWQSRLPCSHWTLCLRRCLPAFAAAAAALVRHGRGRVRAARLGGDLARAGEVHRLGIVLQRDAVQQGLERGAAGRSAACRSQDGFMGGAHSPHSHCGGQSKEGAPLARRLRRPAGSVSVAEKMNVWMRSCGCWPGSCSGCAPGSCQ